jgi:alkylhydroperoxidase/carboxymuconolactone decarboxylase family protein YurZ
MLCALNRSTELGVHVRGALRNGLSEEEIREALLQVGVYVGLPACKSLIILIAVLIRISKREI